ncbi:hypothetical protein SBA5_300005 [Candidatus Sulfotelmatomonas gaucii]|uniref:Helix-turn-helix domain-containing protein n=1 Tax=Candidatus Sulfuritelmatomonas gaucii TaxID=2043161 RepID=A0A2N9LDL3_9BACT|nr:hypothetical protein SBA5_300005 [Candidatus Sulfotelmatomonas gaucii]
MSTRRISVREAANRRGCSLKWIYDLLYTGKLKGEKLGNLWQIDVKSLESVRRRRGRK